MTAQTTIPARPGNTRIDEFTGYRQQVIQGQQSHAPQLDNEHFLSWRERRIQRVRAIRAIL